MAGEAVLSRPIAIADGTSGGVGNRGADAAVAWNSGTGGGVAAICWPDADCGAGDCACDDCDDCDCDCPCAGSRRSDKLMSVCAASETRREFRKFCDAATGPRCGMAGGGGGGDYRGQSGATAHTHGTEHERGGRGRRGFGRGLRTRRMPTTQARHARSSPKHTELTVRWVGIPGTA